MTIQVPKPQKSKAQLAMERAIASSDSISLTLRRALDGVGKALTQEAGVTQISQISPDLGDMTSGAFWALDDEGRPRMVMSARALFEELGVSAYFAGLDVNGHPQFWMDADTGAAVLGDGVGIVDDKGFHAFGKGSGYELTSGTRIARLEDVSGVFQITSHGELGANLLSNPGFENGLTDWTLGTPGTWEAVAEAAYSGVLGAKFTGSAYTQNIYQVVSVTEKTWYRIGLFVHGDNPSGGPFCAAGVAFYDSGMNTLPSISGSGIKHIGKGYQYRQNYCFAPSGAAYARVYAYFDSGGPEFYIDDVSLRAITGRPNTIRWSNYMIEINPTPEETAGVDANRNTSSSYATQTMQLRVFEPMMITSFAWDIRNSGNYELRQVWSFAAADEIRTLWSGSSVGSEEKIIVPNTSLMLFQGTYYFELIRTSGSTTWTDYNAAVYKPPASDFGDPIWIMDGIAYNGSSYGFVPGVKISFQRGLFIKDHTE